MATPTAGGATPREVVERPHSRRDWALLAGVIVAVLLTGYAATSEGAQTSGGVVLLSIVAAILAYYYGKSMGRTELIQAQRLAGN